MTSDKKPIPLPIFDTVFGLRYDEFILNGILMDCIIDKKDHVNVEFIGKYYPDKNSDQNMKKVYGVPGKAFDIRWPGVYYKNDKLIPVLSESPLIITYSKINTYIYEKCFLELGKDFGIENIFECWFKRMFGTDIGVPYVIVFNRLWEDKQYIILRDTIIGTIDFLCSWYIIDFAANVKTFKLFKSMMQFLEFDLYDDKLKHEERSCVFDTFEKYYKHAEETEKEIQKQQEQKKE